ncbi:MAG: DUF3168 domain-containing protein [Campylobacteraceae bacterium]|jgi:hypothetical protein|nr:DUF3168 domain-containing protein [Campylobacteraceae bacterium]
MVNFQIAVRDKLLNALTYQVLDRYPHKQSKTNVITPPYIVIGDDTFVPFDSDGNIGFEATITIIVVSVFKGREECKNIQMQIYNALHRACIEIEGYKSVGIDFEYADTTIESDGQTTLGTQRFRIIGVKNGE